MCLVKSGQSEKGCKAAVVQKDKRGRTSDRVATHAGSFVFDSFRNQAVGGV